MLPPGLSFSSCLLEEWISFISLVKSEPLEIKIDFEKVSKYAWAVQACFEFPSSVISCHEEKYHLLFYTC